ncbi:MAG: inositol monophosphatase family protein [Pseudomonadota bacterium]
MAHASNLITIMQDAAHQAAKQMRRDFGELEALQVSRKGAADFVTAADLKAEQAIYESLSKARPKYGFVLEERGEISGTDNSNRWIVDPLDGTTNFLHGLPHYAISIALERDRQPYAGVVFNPATDELFWAEKGEGAFLNNRRLRVSGRKDPSEALFACGLPFKGMSGREQALSETQAVLSQTAGIRRFGSAALDLAFVAAGRFDAFWERGLNSWDIAAGAVLVREAGGIVSEIDGGRQFLTAGSILASNSALYDQAKILLNAVGQTQE